ncbi:N-glycosylation protein-domain-containing protein [Phellopilus nigrolimitatus]|nr:N-glycosylation protein-domain-containing protein [Phellopilus nigrolimitatus]
MRPPAPAAIPIPPRSPGSSDFEHPRRTASSPQLLRTRARSDSASSSASLTATEDNYNSNNSIHTSASTSRFPVGYPRPWTFTPHATAGPSSGVGALGAATDALNDEGSASDDPREHDDLIYLSHMSSSTNVGSGVSRCRKGAVRREDEPPRMVTTARGQPCAGETETELDELSTRLPTSRVINESPPLIQLPLDFLVRYMFEVSRLLSIVPAVFGTVYNIHHALYSAPSGNLQLSGIDFTVCALWAILTGFQCLALTTGLLSRWKAYYATLSTLIRLVALQGICWPATHLTLQFFDHTKRPVACWALIGTTTCLSRSVQLWVTSNLYKPVSSVGDGKVLRAEGRLGPRRWDWAEVVVKCAMPAGVLYFMTAWAMIMKEELGYYR